jgi:hypothetical protein
MTKSHGPLLCVFAWGAPSWTSGLACSPWPGASGQAVWPPGRSACAMSGNQPTDAEGDSDDGVFSSFRTKSYKAAMSSPTPEIEKACSLKHKCTPVDSVASFAVPPSIASVDLRGVNAFPQWTTSRVDAERGRCVLFAVLAVRRDCVVPSTNVLSSVRRRMCPCMCAQRLSCSGGQKRRTFWRFLLTYPPPICAQSARRRVVPPATWPQMCCLRTQ